MWRMQMKGVMLLLVLLVVGAALACDVVTPPPSSWHVATQEPAQSEWLFRGRPRRVLDALAEFSEETMRRDRELGWSVSGLYGPPDACACRCESCGNCISMTIPCIEFWMHGCYPNCLYSIPKCMADARARQRVLLEELLSARNMSSFWALAPPLT